jgi:CcmD family protein
MENWQYLIGAYTIAWLGIAFYIFINVKKQKILARKIFDLETRTGMHN